MDTVRDYIRERFLLLGLPAVNSLIFDIGANLCEQGLSLDDRVTHERLKAVKTEFVKILPTVLLAPQNISELGVSITMAKREDVISYYHQQCKALGIKDELSEIEAKEEARKKPTIRFL